MSRKKQITISLIAAAFALSVGFAVQANFKANQYRRQLENRYTQAYYELSTAVSELNTALRKLQYSNTPSMFDALSADIYGKTVIAQTALGELPQSGAHLEQTSTFLARVGDYIVSLARSAAAGNDIYSDSHNILSQLAETSSLLSESLLDLQSDIASGTLSISSIVYAEEKVERQTKDGDADPGGTSFQTIEADFPEIPTLIYDGPFSEHLSSSTPLALTGLTPVKRDEARSFAADFLGLRPEVLTAFDQGDGVLPTWGFTAMIDGGEAYIEVTQIGCKVISLFSSRVVADSNISIEDALDLAAQFLDHHGYKDMQESYYFNQGNVLTVNYAPKQDNVLCYPDLVKVSVALDNGRVVGFEGHGWIMNHTDRSLPPVAISAEKAAAVLSPDLEVLSTQLAIIPTGGKYEVLCHEFKCRSADNDNIIVYINCETGNEEQIFLLLEGENGTLVW